MVGLLCLATTTYAQNRKITGRILSVSDKGTLPGVTVKIKGTSAGTVTDAAGLFTLNISEQQFTLEISYVGFITQTVNSGTQNFYEIQLVPDARSLTEVVITGYATQNKREVTGSISSIKGSEIENLPVQTFDKALSGRAAGVQVTTNGGQPGGGINVNIRGTSSINSSTQPLYVIDGMQINPGTFASAGGFSGNVSNNVLSSINPADIESIEILKDAASASIYGSQAGNGVVIVTTKRGKKGKTQIKAGAQVGFAENYNPYKLTNSEEWFTLRKESLGNAALRTGASYQSGVNTAINTYYNGTLPTTFTSYDWVDAVQRKGTIQQYDLSLNGGDEKTKFFLSGSYNNTGGTVLASGYKRGTLRANFSHQATDKLSVESVISLTGSKATGSPVNQGAFNNTPFSGMIMILPINPIYNADGSYNTNLIGTTVNIVQNTLNDKKQVDLFQSVSSLAVNYDFTKNIRWRTYAGIDFSDDKEFNYRPAFLSAASAVNGQGSEFFKRNINWNVSSTLNYNKTFKQDHHFNGLAGVEYRSVTNTVLLASKQGFPSPLYELLSSGATPTDARSLFTGYKTASIISSAKYDYQSKYLASATLRYDGSSRFGTSNKYAVFYGLSAGWRLTAENFLKDVSFLNDLKLKVSYGVVGVQPTDNFLSLSLYGDGGQYNNLPGIRPVQIANPNLSWEQSAQTDIGLDFALFNSRFTGSVDVYRKKNSKLLLARTTPSDTGFPSIFENGGEIEAKGIDIDLNSVNFNSRSFKWTTNFNIGFVKNKLLSLSNGETRIGNTYIVGQPLNLIYTYKYAGVNAADGRAFYYDKNNNLTYNPKTDDQRIVGDTNPSFFGGLGNTFTYRGISLDALFQYQYGNESTLGIQQSIETSGSTVRNQDINQLQRWTTPGQITSVPRPYEGNAEPGTVSNTIFSSRYVETASYIRLKQVNLSYKLPLSVAQRLKVNGLSVFLQATNLATFTNYRGDDPENTGNNLNFYPNPRTFTGGIILDL